MDKRIFGIETEFGCLVNDDSVGTAEQVVEMVKDHAFLQRQAGPHRPACPRLCV